MVSTKKALKVSAMSGLFIGAVFWLSHFFIGYGGSFSQGIYVAILTFITGFIGMIWSK